MERLLINEKSAKKNKNVKVAGKTARNYYGEKLFEGSKNLPKTKVRKFADITDISFMDLSGIDTSQLVEKYTVNTKEALVEICEKNDIRGGSGNGFPVAEKIKSFSKEHGTLIVNGIECDPGLYQDAWIFRNRLSDICKALNIIDMVFDFDRIIYATKEPGALGYSDAACKKAEFIKVKDRFPAGYENFLIKAVTGIELPKDKLPIQEGIFVLNSQSVLSIYDAICGIESGKYRYFSAVNLLTAKATVVRAKLGTKAIDVANTVFGKMTADCYTGAGALRCHTISDEDLINAQTGIIALGHMPDYANAHSCVGCGQCIRNCPAGVRVKDIVAYYEKNGKLDKNICKKYNYEACIGCGACTYFCRAGKDTRELIATLKMS